MSKKSKHEQKEYEYEIGPGGGKKKKNKGKQEQTKGSGMSKSFMIGLLVLLLVYVFFAPTKMANGLVKNADFTVASYSVTNGEIAQQPDAKVHFDADSEQAAALRKILRANTYRTHNSMASLVNHAQDNSDATRMIEVDTGDGKLIYKVLNNGTVMANGINVRMGYFGNGTAQSFVDDVTELMNS